MVFNHHLRRDFLTRPTDFAYDHWLALLASITGKIIAIRVFGLYYRRHEHTVTQVTSFSLLDKLQQKNKKFSDGLYLAKQLLTRLTTLRPDQQQYVNALLQLKHQCWVNRFIFCFKYSGLPVRMVIKLWYIYWICFGK